MCFVIVTVEPPTFEHHRAALGIGEPRPRISWRTSAPAGWTQVAYELRVDDHTYEPVTSAESVLVSWPGVALGSRQAAAVCVRVTGADGSVSPWSPAADVETGLLRPEDWAARPVGAPWAEDADSDDRVPPLVRRDFTVREGLARARLYATAHGLYEVEIDGQRVGDDAMSPGWTSYQHRLRYYTYDVTELLRPGDNTIGAWLGDGWYRGRMGWNGGFRNLFGSDLSLIAQLELTYADGSVDVVATDASWRTATGPIVRTGNYDGELYDARLERPGWSSPGFDDAGWEPVAVGQRDRPPSSRRRARRSGARRT